MRVQLNPPHTCPIGILISTHVVTTSPTPAHAATTSPAPAHVATTSTPTHIPTTSLLLPML